MASSNIAVKTELKDNLKRNLKYLINKYNIDNDTLAKCTGLSLATIASLRSRATNPTILTLQPIAEFFGLTIDQLINSDCSQQDVIDQSQPKDITIPIISLEQAIDWPVKVNHILFDSDNSITTTNNLNGNCFAVCLDSEVLAPNYCKNTILIVDPEKEVEDCSIVILSINNQKPTYRQVFSDSGVLYFKPINPEFGGMQIYQNYTIIGVVVRAVYNFI